MATRLRSASYVSFGTLIPALCFSAAAVKAQQTELTPRPEATKTSPLEEVLVTAQRRVERLQDVPISVTALSSAELATRQITDVFGLQTAAPGLAVSQGLNDPTDITIAIRGLSNPRAFIVVDPAVGIYTDGVYFARTAGANVGFIDMERVEVLRGPQGTLFGRNTIGGALNITTNKPTDTFEGSAEVDLGNFDSREFTGILNTPLISDRLATRIVYQYTAHSGYSSSNFLEQDLDDIEEQHYVRASARLTPSNNWEVLVSGDYLTLDAHTQLLDLAYANPAAPTNALIPAANGNPGDLISNYLGGDFHTNSTQFNPEIRAEVWSGTATITGALGPVTLRSITAYRNIENDRPGDDDGTPYPVIELRTKPYAGHQFSQELHFLGTANDDRLDWIAGLFYFDETGRQGQTLFAAVNPSTPAVRQDDVEGENTSEAAFVQVTYAIHPKFRITGGVRYTEETRQAIYRDRLVNPTTGAVVGCFMSAAIQDSPGMCQATTPEAKFEYYPWTAGVDYSPNDDVMLYGKVSRGFRSGGFAQGAFGPAANPVQLQPFDTEDVLSTEIGAKFQLGGRVLLNLALFDADYEEIQLTQNVTVPGSPAPVAVTDNLGSGNIWGGELEGLGQFGDLKVHVAWGYADGEFTEGPLDGFPFTDFSKSTVSVGGDYTFRVGAGELNFAVDYNYRSKTLFINSPPPLDAAQEQAFGQDGYGLFGAAVALKLANLPLTVSAWGRNLADEEYRTRTLDARALGIIPYTAGEPRTYGVSLLYRFGLD